MSSMSEIVSKATSQSEYSNLLESDKFGIVSVKSYGAVGDGVTDDTVSINNALDYIGNNGGGILFFPAGTYLINETLTIPEGVIVKGTSKSIIQLATSSECDIINITNDDCGIMFITLKGDITGSSGNGIVFGSDSTYLNLRYNYFNNIFIENCAENGIYIYPDTWILQMINVKISNCNNCGIYNRGTDNSFTDIATYNTKVGIYNSGGNNRYNNLKLIFAGYNTPLVDKSESYGMILANCERVQLSNVEIQDCIYNGMLISYCADIQLSNVLLDYNTSIQQVDGNESEVCYELKIDNASRVCGNVSFANYQGYETSTLLNVTSSRDCNISINKNKNNRMSICANNSITDCFDALIKNIYNENVSFINSCEDQDYSTLGDGIADNVWRISGSETPTVDGNVLSYQLITDTVSSLRYFFGNKTGRNYAEFEGNFPLGMVVTLTIQRNEGDGSGNFYVSTRTVVGTGEYEKYNIMSLDNDNGVYFLRVNTPTPNSDDVISVKNFMVINMPVSITERLTAYNVIDKLGGFFVGGKVLSNEELTNSFVWDPADLADGVGETSASITVTGAALGDFVLFSAPYDLQGITANAYVDATNSVKIRLQNETGGNVNLGSGTWKVKVIKA